ncbi:hypothetical protein OT109_05065 [Phycisphaeraceae bacterium D3-23]
MKLGLIILVFLVLGGCASIEAKSFEQFAQAARQIDQGADAVVANNEQWAVERFRTSLREAVAGEAEPMQAALLADQLLLERDRVNTPFGWTAGEQPLFTTSRAFRIAVGEFNNMLIEYAQGLHLLSTAGLTQAEYDALAQRLNGNLSEALGALGTLGGENPESQILMMQLRERFGEREQAIFSTAATELFHQYLTRRQRKELRKALQANALMVEQFAAYGQLAMQIAALQLHREYGERSREMVVALAQSSNPIPKLEEVLALNERYIVLLASLETLYTAYGELPAAHAGLAQSVEDPQFDLGSVRQLVERGRDLQKLAQRLEDAAAAEPESP